MKWFLAIVSIAVMIQASMAGALGSPKRADEVEQAMADMLKLSRELIDVSVTIANAVIEAMPKTEGYSAYRSDLEGYVAVVNDLKNESGNCVLKTGKSLEALFSLFAKYGDEESEKSEEYKVFEDLFEKFGGEEFENRAKEFQKKYYNAVFLEKLESYNEENVENWAFIKENC